MKEKILECEKKLIENFRKQFNDRENDIEDINKLIKLSNNLKKNLKLYPYAKKIVTPKPIKITKKKGSKPVELPDIPGFTRYKNDKKDIERVLFLNDNSNHLFSFNKPLMYLDETGTELIRKYRSFEPGDSLYIWQNLGKKGALHLTGHIVTQSGEHFSIGFGYKGQKKANFEVPFIQNSINNFYGIGQGMIYTPDDVFEKKMQDHLTKKGKYVRLVASISLTSTHIRNLIRELDSIMLSSLETTLRFKNVDTDSSESKTEIRLNLIDKLHHATQNRMFGKEKSYYKAFSDYKSYLESNPKNQFQSIYSIGYSFKSPISYCKKSGSKSSTWNCASFLHNIFEDALNCGILTRFVIDPNRCEQGTLPIKLCKTRIKTKKGGYKKNKKTLRKKSIQENL